jgi:hypothetical protein
LPRGIVVVAFKLWSNANRLAKAHIQSELGWTRTKVDRDNRLAGNRRSIKCAQTGLDDAGPRQVRGKGGPVIEDGIAV